MSILGKKRGFLTFVFFYIKKNAFFLVMECENNNLQIP